MGGKGKGSQEDRMWNEANKSASRVPSPPAPAAQGSTRQRPSAGQLTKIRNASVASTLMPPPPPSPPSIPPPSFTTLLPGSLRAFHLLATTLWKPPPHISSRFPPPPPFPPSSSSYEPCTHPPLRPVSPSHPFPTIHLPASLPPLFLCCLPFWKPTPFFSTPLLETPLPSLSPSSPSPPTPQGTVSWRGGQMLGRSREVTGTSVASDCVEEPGVIYAQSRRWVESPSTEGVKCSTSLLPFFLSLLFFISLSPFLPTNLFFTSPSSPSSFCLFFSLLPNPLFVAYLSPSSPLPFPLVC